METTRSLRFAVLLLLASTGCRRGAEPPPVAVTVGPARALARLGAPVRVGAGGPRGYLAAGTAEGEVLLLTGLDQAPRRLGGVHDGPVTALEFSRRGDHLLSAGGRVVAYWESGSGKKLRSLTGPQPITDAALGPAGVAFFGTDQGHVLRWRLDQQGADAVKRFSCGGERVHPARLNLPPQKRCPYGTYVETKAGLHVCLYPMTHLLVAGGHLVRACRSGNMGFLHLGSLTSSHYLAGHLSALAPLGDKLVVLGRADGKVRLFRRGDKEPLRTFSSAGGRPLALATGGELVAVARPGAIQLHHKDHEAPAGTLRTPRGRRVVWLDLDAAKELRVLLDDGRLLAHTLQVRARK